MVDHVVVLESNQRIAKTSAQVERVIAARAEMGGKFIRAIGQAFAKCASITVEMVSGALISVFLNVWFPPVRPSAEVRVGEVLIRGN